MNTLALTGSRQCLFMDGITLSRICAMVSTASLLLVHEQNVRTTAVDVESLCMFIRCWFRLIRLSYGAQRSCHILRVMERLCHGMWTYGMNSFTTQKLNYAVFQSPLDLHHALTSFDYWLIETVFSVSCAQSREIWFSRIRIARITSIYCLLSAVISSVQSSCGENSLGLIGYCMRQLRSTSRTTPVSCYQLSTITFYLLPPLLRFWYFWSRPLSFSSCMVCTVLLVATLALWKIFERVALSCLHLKVY